MGQNGFMLYRNLRSALLVALCGVAAVASTNSFTGRWKLNPVSSLVPEQIDTVASEGLHVWRFTSGSLSWIVKDDGSEYPTPQGGSVALTVQGPTVWQLTNRMNGSVTSTDTWILDRNSMMRTSKGEGATGERF